jgi:hypothetical protein
MKIIPDFLRTVITGLSFSQEYLCLRKEKIENGLSVFISGQDSEVEVTNNHLFLGYKPVVIGIFCEGSNKDLLDRISLERLTLQLKNNSLTTKVIATLSLKRGEVISIGSFQITLFLGVEGKHEFISPLHQWINRCLEKLRSRKSGNVNLPGNLYDQVRIAYSIPRKISVVSVAENDKMNLFPTDLHGPAGDHFYLESLRLGGMANEQVENQKKIVISEVPSSSYRNVYGLGKKHMKEMTSVNDFEIHKTPSRVFNLPLPAEVTNYYELERVEFYDIGIHRIHLFKILNKESIDSKNDTLSHIHQFYAQWRKNQKLTTDYLFR